MGEPILRESRDSAFEYTVNVGLEGNDSRAAGTGNLHLDNNRALGNKLIQGRNSMAMVNVGIWKAQEEYKFRYSTQCCYEPGFNVLFEDYQLHCHLVIQDHDCASYVRIFLYLFNRSFRRWNSHGDKLTSRFTS